MTVEALDQMMTYVIEGWAIMSATYLSVGFTVSFIGRVRQGWKETAEAAVQANVEAVTIEEATNAERVAEVTAVAEKYGKNSAKTSMKRSVAVPDKGVS